MSVNPRIVPDAVAGGADVLADSAHVAGNPVSGNRGVVLVDGNGNVVKATDNSDGTATLNVAAGAPAAASAGVTPAAGTVLAVDAKAAANAATGTVGSQGDNALAMPLTVIAPIGNSVTVTLASTITGSVGQVDAYASGALQ